MKTIINTLAAPAPIGPYNQAILAGNTLYVSGQIALDSVSGKMIQDSITDETKKVLENVSVILKEAGMGFENIVKTTIFLKNLGDFATVNEIYGSYFSGNYPARETVEVSRLPKEANVEISVIAVR